MLFARLVLRRQKIQRDNPDAAGGQHSRNAFVGFGGQAGVRASENDQGNVLCLLIQTGKRRAALGAHVGMAGPLMIEGGPEGPPGFGFARAHASGRFAKGLFHRLQSVRQIDQRR